MPAEGRRTLVYGAGKMAEAVIPQLLGDQYSQYLPVGLIDDDPAKSTRWISGVRMKGPLGELEGIARSTQASVLLVAISRVDAQRLQEIYSMARQAQLQVVVLPTLNELLTGGGQKLNLKALSIEELIGRRAVETNSSLISERIRGNTVLVTGAGGSIGSELCRQIAQLEPSELIFLDRDESGLQQAQLMTYGQGLLDSSSIVLADIREKDVLDRVFSTVRPDIVFHAAALKHLPVLEKHPEEAWKTNVVGTLNVLEAATRAKVQAFVNISTDKAADPSSVLGRSKLIGEKLTTGFAQKHGARFVSVRFGNVLGSRGSLVPTLATLIERGGPVTITHPDATRYFMTTPEACQLVLHSMVLEGDGDVFLLDMGNPVRILDVAQKMIELAGSDAEIVFTGLREGEKLDEKLHSSDTAMGQTTHPLIWQMTSDSFDAQWVREQSYEVLTGHGAKL
jgi:dTDP-glucose 4,6-dehydratase